MTKSEAIEVLQRNAVFCDAELEDSINLAISALEKQEQDRWIPCSERLPETSSTKLVTFESGEIGMAYIVKSETIYGGRLRFPVAHRTNFWNISEEDNEEGSVVAWRPLPEPYKEEES